MTPARRTLLVSAMCTALTPGSFPGFIATWDAARDRPVSSLPAQTGTAT